MKGRKPSVEEQPQQPTHVPKAPPAVVFQEKEIQWKQSLLESNEKRLEKWRSRQGQVREKVDQERDKIEAFESRVRIKEEEVETVANGFAEMLAEIRAGRRASVTEDRGERKRRERGIDVLHKVFSCPETCSLPDISTRKRVGVKQAQSELDPSNLGQYKPDWVTDEQFNEVLRLRKASFAAQASAHAYEAHLVMLKKKYSGLLTLNSLTSYTTTRGTAFTSHLRNVLHTLKQDPLPAIT